MKIFATIIITVIITWTIGTQFDINWPRIIVVNPSSGEQPWNPTTSEEIPKTVPIPEPPQPSAPSPRILPKIPDTSVVPITPIEQAERDVVNLVNEIRIARGTSALIWDDRLHNLARMHSLDMANRGDMFHSPPDALHRENAFYGAGVNWEAEDIVETWLESELHRTWLLCPNLEHIAVGINIEGGDMYAAWTFWASETKWPDWWYMDSDGEPPDWWY